MLEDNIKLSPEEKAAKKREKIKAKKFSDAEDNDFEEGENSVVILVKL